MSPTPPAGLCNLCAHQRVVTTGRGSVFSMCRRAATDERYVKYPRIPVLACPGFVARVGDDDGAEPSDEAAGD